VGAVRRSGTRIFLWALPFLIMGAVTFADVLTGPRTGLVPLLSLGPAFAAVFHGLRNTALIGAMALALCLVDATLEDRIPLREEMLAFVTVAGVTAAALIAATARQRRDRELADVRTIAEIAQQVVLRPVPAGLSTVGVAVRYLSAAARAQIGGDLYEVMPGADGTLLVVGDVQGKGLTAVQTAAVVLGAFRAAAEDTTGAGLEAIACRIEASLGRQLRGEEFVTAVLAHVSQDGSKVSLLNCGHPSPLLLASGEVAHPVDPLSPSLPLGLSALADVPRDITSVALTPGDGLLFYTDGISEARGRTGAYFPLAQYCAGLDRQDPEGALDRLREDVLRHVGHPLDDDAALLLLTRPAG
jgi:serine phosphatase RsbU (regulator of sigma subunit)